MSQSYENLPVSNVERDPREERPIDAPIVDIVRHGETEYKEMLDKDFVFDPNQEGFALTPEYLDLTSDGIENIRRAAGQLIAAIDLQNEAVLLVASPNYRAQSSALIIADEFKKAGVPLLNGKPKTAKNLRQIEVKNPEADMDEWMRVALGYRSESEQNAGASPDVAYQEVAHRMGRELGDIVTEDFDAIKLRFDRYLRHYGNIRNYLDPKLQDRIADKRLRVISVTHEEIPTMFMREALGSAMNLKKAQILEIRPASGLHKKGETIDVDIELVPKAGEDGNTQTASIRRTFKRDGEESTK
ncbi:MAG: phosphoglycerate mutase family protein [Candidatus Moraniibacteriota bacterium]